MKLADRQILQRLNEIYDAQAAGGAASFASLTGSPSDNAALDSALDAKGPVPSDEAYDATTWNGVTTVAPSKNAVRDKIVSVDDAITNLAALIPAISDAEYGVGWNDNNDAATKNALYDKIEAIVAIISTAPYLVYTALVTQSGTDAPVATVLLNTLGVTISFTYTDVGVYNVVPSSEFADLSKVTVDFGMSTDSVFSRQAWLRRSGSATNSLRIMSADETGAAANDVFLGTKLEIRVYP